MPEPVQAAPTEPTEPKVQGVELTFDQIKEHLKQNNYFARMGLKDSDVSKIDAKSQIYKETIEDFQDFRGLNKDGRPGSLTQLEMQLPRCGMPDHILEAGSLPSWPLSCLTIPTSHKLSTLNGVEPSKIHESWISAADEIRKACMYDLQFTMDESAAKLRAKPGQMPGGTLAWAYLPNNNCSEVLTSEYNNRTNWSFSLLLDTMLHEICHWLGLGHGPPGSVMQPTASGSFHGKLQAWDIDQLVQRVGARTEPIPPTIPPLDGIGVLSISGVQYKLTATKASA